MNPLIDLVVGLTKHEGSRYQDDPQPSVRVILPIGEATHPRALCYLLAPDDLRVKSSTDHSEIRVYLAGQWLRADDGRRDYFPTEDTIRRTIAERDATLAMVREQLSSR